MIKEYKTNLIYGNRYEDDILISFIIPTYNRLNTLKDTIESIIPNGKIKYEIIVIDNSGYNNIYQTKEYLYKKNIEHLSYYANEMNYGMVGNWNAGLNLSRGKFVAYIHDDDILDSCYFDVIDRIINYKIKNIDKIGFIKARFDYFSDIMKIKHSNNHLYTYKRIYKIETLVNGVGPTGPPTCGIIFNRNALIEIDGFDEKLYPCADHIIGFKLLEKKYLGYYTDDIIGHYRWGINESMKKSTLIETVETNENIRHYIYSNNIIYKLFGKIFEKTQYTKDVFSYLQHAKKFKVEIEEREMIQRPKKYIYNKIIYYFFYVILEIIIKIIYIYINIVHIIICKFKV